MIFEISLHFKVLNHFFHHICVGSEEINGIKYLSKFQKMVHFSTEEKVEKGFNFFFFFFQNSHALDTTATIPLSPKTKQQREAKVLYTVLLFPLCEKVGT